MKTKQDIVLWLEDNQQDFISQSEQIWQFAEIAHKEFKSARLQASYLEKQGFSITWNIGGLKTAFVAEWGEGKPVLGFIGEFDALPGLSQKVLSDPEPLLVNGPGHGCGHNLLGTGCLAAAVAVKKWLEANESKATIRYYGCPAEENTYGKPFMARAGVFDDLDVAFNYHPSYINAPAKARYVGVNDLRFRFTGKSAHAGGSPHLGRSALDAVELMNVGVNYLREHVVDTVRMHYAITKGGDAPNIVPENAEVWYFIRALTPEEQVDVLERVRKIARGAAMMTETEVEEVFQSACSSTINNHYLADLHFEVMQSLEPIQYTAEELNFAEAINKHFPEKNVSNVYKLFDNAPPTYQEEAEKIRGNALVTGNYPSLDANKIETFSTDVGDVSQIVPLTMLGVTCFTTGSPGHSWGNTATSGMSIGQKGMLHAAKIMALSAVECIENPQHIENARSELEGITKGAAYQCPIPDHFQPPQFEEQE
ncbi:MAG: amidohydrolase [Anaerolineaceae bacterium]|nr:amidohydrolase [Anaerolineaceae bacterium]